MSQRWWHLIHTNGHFPFSMYIQLVHTLLLMADCAGENWLLALGVNIVCNGLVGMFLWLLKCRVIFSFSQDLLLKIFFFLFKHLLRKSITYKIGWELFVVVYFAAQVFWNIWWKLKSYRGCKWIVIFLSLPLSICKVSF